MNPVILEFEKEYTYGSTKEEWLEDIANTYGDQITKLAFSYLKDWNRAQDVSQEVLLTCFKNYDNRTTIANYKAWIYRVTINRSKDVLKSSFLKRIVLNSSFMKFVESEEATPDNVTVQKEENDELIDAIFALPLKYREVILLHYYEELDTKVISDIINLNENTVRTLLRRARERLKEMLKGASNEKF